MNNTTNNLIKALLSIPKKNLEERIKELEEKVKERLTINEMIISNLQYKRMLLSGQLNTFDYLGLGFLPRISNVENQILKLNGMIHQELVNSFRDISALNEKLREAKEKLAKERGKSKILR